MAVRRESIILELEDNASREALQAAAAFKVLDKSINGLSGTAVRARAFQTISRDVDKMGTSFDRAGSSIDTFSGRLGLLTQAALVLGPAVAPIGASLVPAVAGLATGMAGAAGAAASAGLAFAGVGDALSALNDVKLAPTAENFEKLQQAMDELGPAGANFARFLHSIGGELETLQRTAGANMFPGMQQGLESLVELMPQADRLVAEFSSRLGELSADAGASLAGPQWEAFFSFLETDAAPIFEQFARATGNVALGLGNLMVAFAPLSRDFAAGMLEASRSFAAWSADSSNFEAFIEYVRQVGPQVSDFLGSLAEAAVALTQAVAPWGSVVLPALTTLLDLFTAVAGSSIGPALTTAALAMLTLNKAMSAGSVIMGRVAPAASGASASFGQMRTDLGTVATTWATAGAASERESKKMAAATGRLKGNLATVGKGAGALGAIGVAATGAAQGVGLQNTAMLGLAGTLAGPWGAAAGAGVGLILDMKAAQDQAVAASREFADTLDRQTGALTANSESWVKNQLSADQAQALVDAGLDLDTVTKKVAEGSDAWIAYRESMDLSGSDKGMAFRDDAEDAAAALDKLSGQADNGHQSWSLWADATNDASASAAAAVVSFNELTAAQQAQTQAALAGIDAGTRYGAALAAAQEQADKGTEGLNKFTEAGRANRTALSQLVGSYNAQDAATKNSVKSYNDARRAVAEVGREMGLTAGQIRQFQGYLEKPVVLRVQTKEAQAAIRGAKVAFESLPGEVQSHITTKGVPRTTAEINALVEKYKLTEKQRTALVTLKDAASAGLGNIIRLIHNVKGKTVTVGVNTGNAVSNVAAVQHAINALSGKTVTVTTLQKTIYMAGKQSSLVPDANGGFHVNGAKAFADGGYGMDGRYYSRQPMLIPGGANILWGEKETGWEAYISGKPGERERNLEILAMAGERLGATVIPAAVGRITAYAKGGSNGRGSGTGGSRSLEAWAKMWERAAKTTERALEDHKKQLQRATDRLDYWNQKRDQLKSQVTGSLTRDWFGGQSGNVWSDSTMSGGTAAFAQQQWKKQAADSKKLAAIIANLRKNGAGDAFIAEILGSEDPLAAADMFNKQTKAGMRHSQSLYLSATRATAAAAKSTTAIYADEIRAASRAVQGVRADIKDLNALLKKQHKEAEETRKRESAAKAVSKGARDRR